MPIKVIIAGGRNFNDYQRLCEVCDYTLQNFDKVEIVSGNARGADQLGEKYAAERGYIISQFPADWNNYGNSAGYIRNKEMAQYADGLIAFWNEKSKGTKHMIDLAMEFNLKVKVYYY